MKDMMTGSRKNRLLRGWILLLTVCVFAWVAADIFLTGDNGHGKEEYIPWLNGGEGLIDSPAELFPPDTLPENTTDSIMNLIKNVLDYDKESSGQATA